MWTASKAGEYGEITSSHTHFMKSKNYETFIMQQI